MISCSPRILVDSLNTTIPEHSPSNSDPFAFVFDTSLEIDTSKFLGYVKILDGGLTLKCDLNTVKALAKEQALAMGGNCIYVYEHLKPNAKSTCHRIKGKIYHINNPEEYETEIMWSAERKLKIRDFKGSTEKRPFQAVTFSGINYYIFPKPFSKKYTLKSEAYFDCNLSYFKKSTADELILAHEQVHFDMTELYRRKFINELDSLKLKPKELMNTHEEIFKKFFIELSLKHDEYDSEVYSDPNKQEKWNEWIRLALENSSRYAVTEIEIKGK